MGLDLRYDVEVISGPNIYRLHKLIKPRPHLPPAVRKQRRKEHSCLSHMTTSDSTIVLGWRENKIIALNPIGCIRMVTFYSLFALATGFWVKINRIFQFISHRFFSNLQMLIILGKLV